MKTGPKPRTKEEAVAYLLSNSERIGDCLLYSPKLSKPYRTIRANGNDYLAHRLVHEVINKEIPEVVLHSCDNGCCVEPSHLSSGTHNDNVQDKVSKDRQNKGESSWKTNLTEDQVREIKKSTLGPTALSKIYPCSKGGISNIKAGRTWKHIK